MADIALVWNAKQAYADVSMLGAGLAMGNDLETAVLISLFSDAVSDPSDLLPTDERADPRGWWADTYETPDQIGSQLWQAFWRVRNQDTLNWARDTAQRSLAWLVEDGVASAIDVVPVFYGVGGLALQVTITEGTGRVSLFRFVWDQRAP